MGTTLKHSYQPNGKGAATTESLSQPDDIVTLAGETSATGTLYTSDATSNTIDAITGTFTREPRTPR